MPSTGQAQRWRSLAYRQPSSPFPSQRRTPKTAHMPRPRVPMPYRYQSAALLSGWGNDALSVCLKQRIIIRHFSVPLFGTSTCFQYRF